jgi:hypothetical protein
VSPRLNRRVERLEAAARTTADKPDLAAIRAMVAARLATLLERHRRGERLPAAPRAWPSEAHRLLADRIARLRLGGVA